MGLLSMSISELIYEEKVAIEHYQVFLQGHSHILTPSQKKQIREIIADEKDHMKTDIKLQRKFVRNVSGGIFR